MPLLDFSTPIPTSKPGYWIYWAVTAPLTISVLAIYLTYLTQISRKNREEDKRVREDVTANKVLIPNPHNGQTKPSDEQYGALSLFSNLLRGITFKKSIRGPELNPELGMSNRGELMQSPLNAKTEKSLGNIHRVVPESQPTYMPSDSDTEEDAEEIVSRLPHIRDVPIRMQNNLGITRQRAFQPHRTDASSDLNMEEDGAKIVSALPNMRDIYRRPQCHPNPEISYSMTGAACGPSEAINTATLGKARFAERHDSDFDSDSSYGL